MKTTTLKNLLSKDVIEQEQVAVWHGDKQYISQANDSLVEDIMTTWRRSRAKFKIRELQTLSQPPESATKQSSMPAYACMSSPSSSAQVELCEESDLANEGKPIMCGSYFSDDASLERARKRRTADDGVASCHLERSGPGADQAGGRLPGNFRTDAPHDHANLLEGCNDRHGTPEPSVPAESTRAGRQTEN